MCDYHSFQEVPKDEKEISPPHTPDELYAKSPMNPKNKKPATSTGTDLLEDSFR